MTFLPGTKTYKYGTRAWKGFDWETMNRLHAKGYIADPKGKAKSVTVTEEGIKRAEKLFKQFFKDEGVETGGNRFQV